MQRQADFTPKSATQIYSFFQRVRCQYLDDVFQISTELAFFQQQALESAYNNHYVKVRKERLKNNGQTSGNEAAGFCEVKFACLAYV
jgi:hypothetical protein